MGIESENFVMHLAAAMNQTTGAGGKMSNIVVADNVLAAVVDDISEAERAAGGERKYKLYLKVGNADNKTYQNAMLYLGYPLTGGNVSSIIKGNFTDSWAEVSGNRKYGCANLKAATSLTAGDVTAVVNTRGQSYAHFQTGDTVAVFDQFNPEDITGHTEFKTLTNVSWNGDEATLTFDSGLKYGYASSRTLEGNVVRTRVSSCVDYGDVLGSFSVTDKASAAGTYVETDTVKVDSIASITQTFTFTFDGATSFTVAGDSLGALPSGSTGSSYEPQNGDYARQYLTVPPGFWTGTWANGDSVKIHTNPCAMPHWVYIDIKVGAEALDLELIDTWGTGHSGSL